MIRTLLIAEAANPAWISVPLVGWSHARALAEVTNADLVTQIRNQTEIERITNLPFSSITYINSEAVARPLWRLSHLLRGGAGKGWTAATAINTLSYYYFEHLVWKQFHRAIQSGMYDIVHRITPLSPTTPSLLARHCRRSGIPFVVGPLNGGLPWPSGFTRSRLKEHEWLSYFRWLHQLLPGFSNTRRDSAAILVGSLSSMSQMPLSAHSKCVYIPENGIDTERFPPRPPRQPSKPIRAVFVGRLVPYKGADLAIEAATELIHSGHLQLRIVGDGPERLRLQQLVDDNGLSHAVQFVGWVPHSEVKAHLASSDLFLFPSIREFGGAVVLEAMACGAVPIVIRYGGPGELASPSTAFLVEIGNRQSIIQQIKAVLAIAVASPQEITRRSRLGLDRVAQMFTWEQKAQQVLRVYESVLSPDIGDPSWPAPFSDTPTGMDWAKASVDRGPKAHHEAAIE